MNRFQKGDALGFRGTSWNTKRQKWLAQIRSTIGGERRHYFLGHFDTREEAAAAYQGAAKILHREFRRRA
jgi:hypothetical protein